jgi:hypothetical protein
VPGPRTAPRGLGHADPPGANVARAPGQLAAPPFVEPPHEGRRGRAFLRKRQTCNIAETAQASLVLMGAAGMGGQRPGRRRLLSPPLESGPGTLTRKGENVLHSPCITSSRRTSGR